VISFNRGNSRLSALLASSVENGGTVTSTASMPCLRMIWCALRVAKGTHTTCGSGHNRFLIALPTDDFQLFREVGAADSAAALPGGEIIPHSFCWSANGSSGVNE
jgi:hypothetical protein